MRVAVYDQNLPLAEDLPDLPFRGSVPASVANSLVQVLRIQLDHVSRANYNQINSGLFKAP